MGKPTVRKADDAAGRGKQKKRRLRCNGADRAAVSGDTQLERVQTSAWSFITRELEETLEEGKQMKVRKACAPSKRKVNWNQTDWATVNRNVKRLQVRIVKATQEGRWGKVKALQRLLTRSYSGKVLAVRRVTENRGKRTAGVDGETLNTPAQKGRAVERLKQRGYRAKPLKRAYIPKKNGKLRPLGIPTMQDRAMQALYLLALEPVAETQADLNSYGFRRERSTADAIEQCFKIFSRRRTSPEWVLEGDIRACFDQISHTWLQAHIPTEKAILAKWLKAGYMEKQAFHPTEAGTPQGGIISPVLANMALDGLEAALYERYRHKNRNKPSTGVNMVRYADDFIISGRSRDMLVEIQGFTAQFLAERGLELSPEKTRLTHIDEGFDFLGQNIRRYNGKLIIKPSKKNRKAFLEKVRGIIKANPTMKTGVLIKILNPILRGWANYHRHVCSKQTYRYADYAIFKALWRWARRRHRKDKNNHWVRQKYFRTHGKQTWTFTGETSERGGAEKTVHLLYTVNTPIRRHAKIKAQANPFDPKWELYFEKRIQTKMAANLSPRLMRLWQKQDGKCPACQQTITLESGWHAHHVTWRSKGGGNQLQNLAMLHPACHRLIHAQRLEVVKLRPETGVRKA
jgi:RNA-directed DNA polymerase